MVKEFGGQKIRAKKDKKNSKCKKSLFAAAPPQVGNSTQIKGTKALAIGKKLINLICSHPLWLTLGVVANNACQNLITY